MRAESGGGAPPAGYRSIPNSKHPGRGKPVHFCDVQLDDVFDAAGLQWCTLAAARRHLARMKPFRVVTGVAAPLPLSDVDTEMIVPRPCVNTAARSGLGAGLFHDLRYHADGSLKADFILNRRAYRRARILVAGRNLGTGCSGEHAAWALDDFGIRCVISSSIADVFYANCGDAGVLPIVLEQPFVDELMADAMVPPTALMTVDLHLQEIVRAGGQIIRVDVASPVRERLLEGADEIDMSLQD